MANYVLDIKTSQIKKQSVIVPLLFNSSNAIIKTIKRNVVKNNLSQQLIGTKKSGVNSVKIKSFFTFPTSTLKKSNLAQNIKTFSTFPTSYSKKFLISKNVKFIQTNFLNVIKHSKPHYILIENQYNTGIKINMFMIF